MINLDDDTPIIVMGDRYYFSYSRRRYIHETGQFDENPHIYIQCYPLVPFRGAIFRIVDNKLHAVKTESMELLEDAVSTDGYIKFMDLLSYYKIWA